MPDDVDVGCATRWRRSSRRSDSIQQQARAARRHAGRRVRHEPRRRCARPLSNAVARVDQARLMLAVYAVVLLLAVGLRRDPPARQLPRDQPRQHRARGAQRVARAARRRAHERARRHAVGPQGIASAARAGREDVVARSARRRHQPRDQHAAAVPREQRGADRRSALGLHAPVRHDAASAAFSIKSEDFHDRAEYQAQFVHALKDVKIDAARRGARSERSRRAEDLTRDSIAGLGELTEMAQSLKDFSRLDRAPDRELRRQRRPRQDAADREERREAQGERQQVLRRDPRDPVLAVADQPGVPEHHHERRAGHRDAGRDHRSRPACTTRITSRSASRTRAAASPRRT